MQLSREVAPRWVIEDVDRFSIQTAKFLAYRYSVRIHDIVQMAIERMAGDIASGTFETPDGWTARDW